MKPAPKPQMPHLVSNVTARIKPWSPSRGPRLAVAHLRRITGADMCLDFTGPDEFDMPSGIEARGTELRDRCTTPSAELVQACKRLSPITGLPEE